MAPVSKSIPFEADVSVPTLESIPSEEEAPIQGDLEAPIAEPMPIVLKESAIPIVEEPLLQEDIAPELEMTPTVVQPEVLIIEKSMTQENMAP